MSAVAIIDPAIYTDPTLTRRGRELIGYMAGKVDPNGITHVSDARIMRDLGWSQRTVTRARADLYATRWAKKLGGGYTGTASVVRLMFTFTRDTARRAIAAMAIASRDRKAAARAYFAARTKVATPGPPTIPLQGLGAPQSAGAPRNPQHHPYIPDEYDLSCRQCSLPRGNRAHQAG
jgi:hypothetical protein